jgi:hypothetical protein
MCGRVPDMPPDLKSYLPTLQRRGGITNQDVRRMARVARNAALRMLKEWSASGWLVAPKKQGLGAVYTPGPRLLHQSQIAPQMHETGAMKK